MRPPTRPLVLAAAAFLLGVATLATARAQDGATHFSLSWVRLPSATSCISGQELAARVEERLGRRVFEAPAQADVGIEGHVERGDNGWHATVSITDSKGSVLGTRELSSGEPSCHDLDAPLALTIALFVDPNAALSPETPPAVPAARAAAVVPPAPPPPRAPQETHPPKVVAPRPEPEWRSAVEIGAGVAVGLLPGVSPGITLRSEVRPPRFWPIAVEGTIFPGQRALAPQNGTPITFSLELAGVTTCPLALASRVFGVEACAGLDAGVLSSEGPAADAVVSRHRFFAAAVARIAGFAHLGRHFFLAASPSLVVPIVRDSFDYDWNRDPERVFHVSPVAFAVDVSLGFQVP